MSGDTNDVLVAWLRNQGRETVAIRAAEAGTRVILTTRGGIESQELWYLGLFPDSITVLKETDPVGPYVPHIIAWVDVGAGERQLRITDDYRSEAVFGTALFRLTENRLVRTYVDPGRSCRPASLEDVDHDGVAELLVYGDDASGACTAGCYGRLEDRLGLSPGWVSVRVWRDDEWKEDISSFRAFYREMSRTYRAAADSVAVWNDCAEERIDRELFVRLAASAQEAGGSP